MTTIGECIWILHVVEGRLIFKRAFVYWERQDAFQCCFSLLSIDIPSPAIPDQTKHIFTYCFCLSNFPSHAFGGRALPRRTTLKQRLAAKGQCEPSQYWGSNNITITNQFPIRITNTIDHYQVLGLTPKGDI